MVTWFVAMPILSDLPGCLGNASFIVIRGFASRLVWRRRKELVKLRERGGFAAERIRKSIDVLEHMPRVYPRIRLREVAPEESARPWIPRIERLAPLSASSHRTTPAHKTNFLVEYVLPAVRPLLRLDRALLVANAPCKVCDAPPVVCKLKRSRSTLPLRDEFVELARTIRDVAILPICVPAVLRILPVVVYHRLDHERKS